MGNKKKNNKNHSQKIGEKGEKCLIDIFIELLDQFSQISSLRRYDAGYQGGKDVKAEAILKKNNFLGIATDEKLKWFFEVKYYKSKLNIEKFIMKLFQLKQSNLRVDCFCLFSPHENLQGWLEDGLEDDRLVPVEEFPFKIVLWTPSHRIKEKLKCFPGIYEDIYGEKINPSKEEIEKIQGDWIKEIHKQTTEGKTIKDNYLKKWKGNAPIWVPESIEEAQKTILESEGDLKKDTKKAGTLEQKLNYGGIKTHQDILLAKRTRIFSEGTRRKYKKINEDMFIRLNALRHELEVFCLELEKNIFDEEKVNEAELFIRHFSKKIEKFKEQYQDFDLIQKFKPYPLYFDGQMYDITGECTLSLSKKWLKEIGKLVDENE